jgi:hypothetical protein
VAAKQEPVAQIESIVPPSAEDVAEKEKDQAVSADAQDLSFSRGKVGQKSRSTADSKQAEIQQADSNTMISVEQEAGNAPQLLEEDHGPTNLALKEAAVAKGPMVETAVQTVAAFSACWDIACGDVVISIGPFCVAGVQGYLDVRPGVRIVVQYIGDSSNEDEQGYLYGTRLGPGIQAGPGWFPASVVIPMWECPSVRRTAQQSNDVLDLDCTICMDKRRDVLCLPCSHMPVCSGCWDAVSALAGVARKITRCPLCRAEVEQVHTVKW